MATTTQDQREANLIRIDAIIAAKKARGQTLTQRRAFANSQYDKICSTLAEHPAGLTADELDVMHGWADATSGRRLKHLVTEGRVVRTERTRATRMGKQARVHVLAA